MADYITLLGAEGVARAGRAMNEAAATIQQSVNHLTEALSMHARQMDEFVSRLEQLGKADRIEGIGPITIRRIEENSDDRS